MKRPYTPPTITSSVSLAAVELVSAEHYKRAAERWAAAAKAVGVLLAPALPPPPLPPLPPTAYCPNCAAYVTDGEVCPICGGVLVR